MKTRLLIAAFALSLGFAGAAEAKTRIASPSGATTGDCTSTPCTLTRASNLAVAGDEVLVRTGTYPTLTAPIAITAPSVSIHGDFGAPMPRISYAAPGTEFQPPALSITGAGDSIAHLEVVVESSEENGLYCESGGLIEGVRVFGGQGVTAIQVDPPCTVSNSLAVGRGPGSHGITFQSIDPESISGAVRNSTAIGATGIEAEYFAAIAEGSLSVSVTDTIASGTEADLAAVTYEGEGQASIIASHSNFNETIATPGGSIADAGGNQGALPRFVDAASGNFAEAPDSPTIDAGVLLPGMPALDLAGNPRVLGGRIDIGAFEFVPPPAPSSPATPSAAPPVIRSLKVSPSAFRAANAGGATASARGKGNQPPIGATVSYSLSAAGTVSFSVQRKTSGRKVGGGCVRPTRGNASKPACTFFKPLKGGFALSGAAGANSFKFRGRLGGKTLSPGGYRLLASAGAAASTAGFTIVE
jgi:hypothetical protein